MSWSHALTHMHTHTYTIYDDYIVSENRQNLPECAWLLHKDYEFPFQQISLPQSFSIKQPFHI